MYCDCEGRTITDFVFKGGLIIRSNRQVRLLLFCIKISYLLSFLFTLLAACFTQYDIIKGSHDGFPNYLSWTNILFINNSNAICLCQYLNYVL